MSSTSKEFVSVFKIDGVPIMPPVIDDQRRLELNHDKLRAIEIERRLEAKRKLKSEAMESTRNHLFNSGTAHSSLNSEKTMVTSPSNYDISAAVESITEDSSRTIKADFREIGDGITQADSGSLFTKKFNELNIDGIKPLTLNIDAISQSEIATEYSSPSFSLHSSPSLGALNDSRNQSLYFTPMSGRETYSPNTDDLRPGPLIRSNSYTLEKPSPMLLQHMEANGISVNGKNHASNGMINKQKLNRLNYSLPSSTPRKSSIINESNGRDSKSKLPKSSLSSRKSFSPVRHATTKGSVTKRKSPQNGAFKNTESILRSVYAPISQSSKKTDSHKKPSIASTSQLNSSVRVKTKSPPNNTSQQTPTDRNQYNNIIKLIEEQHTAQMNALIQRQKEEQQRIHEEFQRQQETILKQISEMIARQNGNTNRVLTQQIVNLSKSNQVETPNDNDNESILDSNGNRILKKTPDSAKCARRLYYDYNNQVNADLMVAAPELQLPYTADEIKAATTINAYVRGYLTRRLFKTNKVKNIVKTIRDTLILILDIHFEDDSIETAADIELKTHLIQQLTSANYNLHNIFIKIPMAERMDIIAKDREWQQFKLSRSKSESSNTAEYKYTFNNDDLAFGKIQNCPK